jgi:hypothetical protein
MNNRYSEYNTKTEFLHHSEFAKGVNYYNFLKTEHFILRSRLYDDDNGDDDYRIIRPQERMTRK